jgi:hypothetical protein
MEKALRSKHQRGVIKEEASWRMHHGGGIGEAASGRKASRKRNQGGGIMGEVHGGGILDEISWRREASWRRYLKGGRHHGGASWRHLGDIWEASGRTSWRKKASWRRHLGGGKHHGGASWRHMGDIWEESGRTSWRKHHGGGILEEGSIMEEHPGSIWNTSGMHQRSIW